MDSEIAGGSEWLGPPPEWHYYTDESTAHRFHEVFWRTIEDILCSFPGPYEELPWVWTEAATEKLAQN